jgi:hypothetical protein
MSMPDISGVQLRLNLEKTSMSCIETPLKLNDLTLGAQCAVFMTTWLLDSILGF